MSGTTIRCKLGLIQSAVDALEGHGLQLVRRNAYGIDFKNSDDRWIAKPSGHVCLCGAIAFVLQPKDHGDIVHAVARKLGIRPKDAQALSDGFESEEAADAGSPRDRRYMYWFRVGRRFGAKTPREPW